MIKKLFWALLVMSNMQVLHAQSTNLVGKVFVNWDTLKRPKTAIKKYHQYGNKLLAETDYTFSYKCKNHDIATTNLKYVSDDFGFTWRKAAEQSDISRLDLSLMAKDTTLYRFSIFDNGQNIIPGTYASTLNFAAYQYYRFIKKSTDSLNFNTIDTFRNFFRFRYTTQDFSEEINTQLKVIDSTLFKIETFYQHTVSNPTRNYQPYYTAYSTNGGISWKPINFGFYDRPNIDTRGNSVEFAANGFFAFKKLNQLRICKYPNLSEGILSFDTIDIAKNFSICQKDSTIFIYMSDGIKSFVRVVVNKDNNLQWNDIPLPVNIIEREQDESTVYIDREQKYIYLMTTQGVLRSEDPLFRTYHKVANIWSTPIAFSILPSGIYMNGEDGAIMRSEDKGDTWFKIIHSGINESKYINYTSLVAIDTTVTLQQSNDKVVKTSDFNNLFFTALLNNLDLKKVTNYPNIKGYKLNIDNDIFIGNYYYNQTNKKWIAVDEKIIVDSLDVYYITKNGENYFIRNYTGDFSNINSLPTYIRQITATYIKNSILYIYYKNINDNKYYFGKNKSANYEEGIDNFPITTDSNVKKIYIDGDKIVLISDKGSFYLSEDEGQTWLQTNIGNSLPLNIDKYKQNILIKNDNGTFITHDYGISWKQIINIPQNWSFTSANYLHAYSKAENIEDILPIRTNIDSVLIAKPFKVISEQTINLCKGSLYDGVPYFTDTEFIEKNSLVSTDSFNLVKLININIKPTYVIQKDTFIKFNQLFDNQQVTNNQRITKSFKTATWECDSVIEYRIIREVVNREDTTIFICQGGYFNGKPVPNAGAIVNSEIIETNECFCKYNTINIKTIPKITIEKDTFFKPNQLFDGILVSEGLTVTKSFKTQIGNCDSFVIYNIRMVTSSNDLNSEFILFKLYPNPATDYISISYELKKATTVEIELYNAIGQKIKTLQEKTKNTEGVHTVIKDIKGLQGGIYQIGIKTEKGEIFRRFIKS